MLNELNHEIIPTETDNMNSMTENRSPFLDKNLVRFAYQIPNRFIDSKWISKMAIKRTMREIVINGILLDTRKGFNASIVFSRFER